MVTCWPMPSTGMVLFPLLAVTRALTQLPLLTSHALLSCPRQLILQLDNEAAPREKGVLGVWPLSGLQHTNHGPLCCGRVLLPRVPSAKSLSSQALASVLPLVDSGLLSPCFWTHKGSGPLVPRSCPCGLWDCNPHFRCQVLSPLTSNSQSIFQSVWASALTQLTWLQSLELLCVG